MSSTLLPRFSTCARAANTTLASQARHSACGSAPARSSAASVRAASARAASSSAAAAAPAPAAAEAALSPRALLQLYARVLRTHRSRLPFHLRELGDRYVRDEFRKHRAADARWQRGFAAGWADYVRQLESQGAAEFDAGAGSALDPAVVKALSDEQKNQLAALRYEAERAFKRGDDDEAPARGLGATVDR